MKRRTILCNRAQRRAAISLRAVATVKPSGWLPMRPGDILASIAGGGTMLIRNGHKVRVF